MIRLHRIDGRVRVSAKRIPRGWAVPVRVEVTSRSVTAYTAWTDTVMKDAWMPVSLSGRLHAPPETTLRAAVEVVIGRRDFMRETGLLAIIKAKEST